MFWFLGLGLAILGGVAVLHYWNDIKKWFAGLLSDVAQVIRKLGEINPQYQYATEVVAILLEAGAAMIEQSIYIEQKDGSFEVTTTKGRIPNKNELPPNIKDKLQRAGNVIGKRVEAEREMKIAVEQY